MLVFTFLYTYVLIQSSSLDFKLYFILKIKSFKLYFILKIKSLSYKKYLLNSEKTSFRTSYLALSVCHVYTK